MNTFRRITVLAVIGSAVVALMMFLTYEASGVSAAFHTQDGQL